jgi:hypothetical protein
MKDHDPSKQRRMLALQKKYSQRVSYATQAKNFFAQKDYVNAVKKYNEYLGILTETHNLDDWFKLDPKLFPNKSDIPEVFLISQVFWELSKIYETLPKADSTYEKCMNSYIRFSVNQPFQHINAEMLRKHIKKLSKNSNKKELLDSYLSKIYKKSGKCYIASFLFGEEHHITNSLRSFKRDLDNSFWGRKFIFYYYLISPQLVLISSKNILLKFLIFSLFFPLVLFVYCLYRFVLYSKKYPILKL